MSATRGLTLCSLLSIGLSFNQPRFCPEVTWSRNGITFAGNATVGTLPTTVFVDDKNSVYVVERQWHQVQVWVEGNNASVRTVSAGLFEPHGLFVTSAGDIYLDNSMTNNRAERWAVNDTSGVAVMNVSQSCYGLFVSIDDMLYCSSGPLNQVFKQSLSNMSSGVPIPAAGNGTAGSSKDMLSNPHGIFVDENLNLYVADRNNDRIQRFESNNLNGTTAAGAGIPAGLTLSTPMGVIMDGGGYLFIADSGNNRIVRVGTIDFWCIIGCTRSGGSALHKLHGPWSLSFDTYGNLFVSDRINARIQKFMLLSNVCGKSVQYQREGQ